MVSGTNYYALWADNFATITVESGNFTSTSKSGHAVIHATNTTNKEGWVYIKGGTFVDNGDVNVIADDAKTQTILQGGTYNQKPAGKLAEGYNLYWNGISSYVVATSCPSGYSIVKEAQ